MTSDGGGVLSGSTLTATRPILHIATDGTYWGYYQTGPQSYSAACTGAAHTNSTIGSVISFRQGSAGGPAIPFTVFLTNTPDGGPAPDYVTMCHLLIFPRHLPSFILSAIRWSVPRLQHRSARIRIIHH